jgi:hypothetical protein
MALACVQTKGAAMTQTCFTSAITPIATNTTAVALIPCLTQNSAACGGPVVDGGEGGTDAPTSDAPTSDAPASDAPASDAPASDAPTGG